MLPATLVTLVTFLLDLTNSSPVYNMQPAFITTNIGSTNGRNIRNLPCVSRKNSGLSGVCMFAIDCLKSNGTHLGTCIDRFYFGSCCHIEPIKDIGNSIETNIILDSREPPQRLQNKTSLFSTGSPQSSLSSISSSSTTPTSVKLSQETKESTSFITTHKSTITKVSSTTSPSASSKPSSITRPYGEKLPQGSTTTTSSTTEVTTIAQKLQTFQIVDGTLVEATTLKPLESGTTKRTSSPIRTSTKLPSTSTKPRPGVTSPSQPTRTPLTTTSKITTKPTKPSKPTSSRKPTQKPSKPVKVSSTTRRPLTTTTKSTSTRRTVGTKPTRRVTKPSTNRTSAKPVTTTSKRPQQTTTEKPTRKPPLILTKKPLTTTSTTTSTVVTKKPSTSTSPLAASISTSSIPKLPSSSSQASLSTSTASSITTSSPPLLLSTTSNENLVPKKNISQILESGTINTATNEVIESSGYLTFGNTTTSTPSTSGTIRPFVSSTTTDGIKTTSIFNSLEKTNSSSTPSSTFSTRPSTLTSTGTSNATSTSTTAKPIPGIITWTLEDTKNHTAVNMVNDTVAVGNITEEWVPITTPDGWVLLPSVTPVTATSSFMNNETSTSSTLTNNSVPSAETISTFIPIVTLAPEISSTSSLVDVAITSPDLLINSSFTDTSTQSSTSVQESTSSSTSLVTSIVTSTSEGEKGTTSIPSVTELVGNVTAAGGEGIETSSIGTSTEYVPDTKPVNMSDFTDVCGRRMWPEARIVGGEKSTFGKWPWQISLRQWRTSTYLHKCGAALLNENWAITAAHCVDNVPPSDLLLRLGEHDLSTETEPYLHEERRVQIVASHPQFDPRTFEYDLALLRFYEPVQFQPNILPVCVPTKEESFVGRTAYVTGWGRLYEDGPLPSILQEVSVPVINNSVCESMYRSAGYIEHIPHIFICAGWRKGGFDSCEGDSGGPMVIQREDNRFLLAGVISWGIGCAEPNQPGVYTRISEFRDWINQILQF